MNPFDPMPTIQSILGRTMAQDIEQSILLAELDDFEAPQCEVSKHNSDPHHSGPARFLLITPCHHHEGYVCAPAVGVIKASMRICECGQTLQGSEMTFLPIGGQK